MLTSHVSIIKYGVIGQLLFWHLYLTGISYLFIIYFCPGFSSFHMQNICTLFDNDENIQTEENYASVINDVERFFQISIDVIGFHGFFKCYWFSFLTSFRFLWSFQIFTNFWDFDRFWKNFHIFILFSCFDRFMGFLKIWFALSVYHWIILSKWLYESISRDYTNFIHKTSTCR